MSPVRFTHLFFALLSVAPPGAQPAWPQAPAYPLLPGTPVARSVEIIHNQVKLGDGPFRSGGYFTSVYGLSLADLFNTNPASNPVYDHTTARFSHTEVGSFETAIPRSPASLVNGLITTRLRGTAHCLFYNPTPTGRDWARPATFATGQLVAKWLLEGETDVIDVASRVGTGVSVATLVCRRPVPLAARPGLAAGSTFDFASLGKRIIATFQFQITPQLVPTLGGLVHSLGQSPLLIGDSGLWQFQEAGGGALPACAPLPAGQICAP